MSEWRLGPSGGPLPALAREMVASYYASADMARFEQESAFRPPMQRR